MIRNYPQNWRTILADLLANPGQAKEITKHLSEEHRATMRWEYQMERAKRRRR